MEVDNAEVQSPSENTSLSSPTQPMSSLSSPFTDDAVPLSNEATTEEIAADFQKFLIFDTQKEEAKFNDSVELMLTKLDEFFSLVDMIRSDTTLCLQSTMPDIQKKCKEMEAVFEKIDKLEEFIIIVGNTLTSMEEKVVKAEAELGTVGGFVKKLTSFISKKPSPALTTPRTKRTEFIPPEIFSTESFFAPQETSPSSSGAASSQISSNTEPSSSLTGDNEMDSSGS